MDYNTLVNQKYYKMAARGIKLPFTERWEAALVGVQALYEMNAKLETNAIKLLAEASDKFNDDFSNGVPMEVSAENMKYLSLYLRAQNQLRVSYQYLNPNLERLDALIVPAQQQIDIGVWKYYAGNKSVLRHFMDEVNNQIDAISNSTEACFINAKDRIRILKADLNPIFKQTRIDVNNFNSRISEALGLEDIMVFNGE